MILKTLPNFSGDLYRYTSGVGWSCGVCEKKLKVTTNTLPECCVSGLSTTIPDVGALKDGESLIVHVSVSFGGQK